MPRRQIPSSIRILMDEPLPVRKTWPKTKRAIRDFVRDVREEADRTLWTFPYVGAQRNRSTTFTVVPSGPLNPFSEFRSCWEPDCRRAETVNFARTLGVYADRIVVLDELTDTVAMREDWSDADLLNFLGHVDVLKILRPLIEDGVIQFASPVIPFCTVARQMFEESLDAASDRVFEAIEPMIDVKRDASRLWVEAADIDPSEYVHFEPLFGPRKHWKPTDPHAQALAGYRRRVASEVRDVVFAANKAEEIGAMFLSSARLDTHSLCAR